MQGWVWQRADGWPCPWSQSLGMTPIENDPGKINLAGIDDRSPFPYAAGNVYTLIVDHLEDGGFADAADIKKRTPLLWAAASGHISTSQLLLINIADSDSQDIEGKPPLIYEYIYARRIGRPIIRMERHLTSPQGLQLLVTTSLRRCIWA